jgi:mannose-6-phosphate isomerase-like protein (cupin superfamily)
MLKKTIQELPFFTAGDETRIREVLHPKNDGLDFGYSLAYAELDAGDSSLPHILHHQSETYIIQRGEGIAVVDGKEVSLKAGEVVYIPAGSEQSVTNTGTELLAFWCVVLPPWSASTEEITSR